MKFTGKLSCCFAVIPYRNALARTRAELSRSMRWIAFSRVVKDSVISAHKRAGMEKRLTELEASAAKAESGELKKMPYEGVGESAKKECAARRAHDSDETSKEGARRDASMSELPCARTKKPRRSEASHTQESCRR